MLLTLQSEHRLPAAYQFGEYAAEGAVMSCGPNGADAYREGALYLGRILKSENRQTRLSCGRPSSS